MGASDAATSPEWLESRFPVIFAVTFDLRRERMY